MRKIFSQWPFRLCTCMFLVVILCITINFCFPLEIPRGKESYSTLVLARDGQTLRAFADADGIWRQQVRLKDVSPLYVEALLSYEDQYFWQHPGINPVSLLRALWLNWRNNKIVSGGSTISMQVARILHPHSRTIQGKLYQIFRTIQLELLYSKKDILELYLNFAPFGGTIEGVEAASQAYLDKSSFELTHAEAALLAVLPQRPSMLRPDRFPSIAAKARNKVLNRLEHLSVWTPDTVLAAKREKVIANKPDKPRNAPLLSRYLKKAFPDRQVIESTLDFHLQVSLETLLKNHIDRTSRGSSGAILIMDNEKQEIIAWLGSSEFSNQKRFGHVDMVSAIRSPGSTLKPFIYGLAIDNHLIHSHSLLSDAPRIHSNYRPNNFDHRFRGPVTTQFALQQSLNVPAVQVLESLGSSELFNRLRSAGIQVTLPQNSRPNLALALGGAGTSLWDLVMAYASFASGGKAIKPSLTKDKVATKRHLMSSQAAWIVYKMLAENPRTDTINSDSILKKNNQIAWKTGTSYGFRDAWALGVSRQYTLGVWLGRPDGTPQPGHYGALNAAPLLFTISDRLHRRQSAAINAPEGVSKTEVCWPLGTPAISQHRTLCHEKHQTLHIDGVIPPTLPPPIKDNWQVNPITLWIDTSNGKRSDFSCAIENKVKMKVALWPIELESWISPEFTRRNNIPAPSGNCPNVAAIDFGGIQITGVRNNSKFLLLDKKGDLELKFSTLGAVGISHWYVNGNHIESVASSKVFEYHLFQPGSYQIAVIDGTGATDKVEISVGLK